MVKIGTPWTHRATAAIAIPLLLLSCVLVKERGDVAGHDTTENEVKTAIFQMEHNKAPGPDGFPPEFYQVFWDVIKGDLMALFRDFQQGTLSLNSLNFGTTILLPK